MRIFFIFTFNDWRFNILGSHKSKFVDLLDRTERICYGPYLTWTPYDAILLCSIFFPETIIESQITHANVELKGKYTRKHLARF